MTHTEPQVRNMSYEELLNHLEDIPDNLLRPLLGDTLEAVIGDDEEIECLYDQIDALEKRLERLTKLHEVEECDIYPQGVAQ